jgi:hypothetical protein
MRVDELRASSVPIVYDRALTHVIRSRRLLEETERRLVEALMIVRTLSGPDAGEDAAWDRPLEGAVRALADVRTSLVSLIDRPEPPPS